MKRRHVKLPIEQGDIDGLCSVYSVLNSCKLLFGHGEKLDEQLFKTLCSGIDDLFPQILWEGTGVPTVYRLLKFADAWTQKHHRRRLHWRAPLMRTKFRRVEDYLERLRHDLDERAQHGRGVWIVGLGDPWDHWTTVNRISGRTVWFYDSWGLDRHRFDAFTFDEKKAGEGKGKKIMLDQHQSFLVWREN